MTASVFEMSIEDVEGHSFKNALHLGTDEAIARSIVVERFIGRTNVRWPTVSMAHMRDGKIVDVFYGDKWQSEYEDVDR